MIEAWQRFFARRWTRLLRLAAMEIFIVAGIVGSSSDAHVTGRHADLISIGLMVVAVGAWYWAPRWPLRAFTACLGATELYFGLGYNTSSPWFFALWLLTFMAVIWDRPLRSLLLVAAGTLSTVAVGYLFVLPGHVGWEPLSVLWGGVLAVLAGHGVGYSRYVGERNRAAEHERETQRRIAEERMRIARDLHDVVAHTISLINVQAGVAAHVLDEQPEQAKESLRLIKKTSGEALQELRAVLDVLRQVDDAEGRAPTPGLDRVEELIEASTRAGLSAAVSVDREPYRIPAALDVAAYRIVQESLTNALRHAQAQRAEVSISYRPGRLVVEVIDDGRGPSANGNMPGHGIAGMRERAAAVGGELEAGPRPVRGFRVHASLPVPDA